MRNATDDRTNAVDGDMPNGSTESRPVEQAMQGYTSTPVGGGVSGTRSALVRPRRRIAIVSCGVVLLVIVVGALVYYAWRSSIPNPALDSSYQYKVCTVAELKNAIGLYKSNKSDELRNLTDKIVERDNNQLDAKCNYIQTLDFIKSSSKMGATSFIAKCQSAVDSTLVGQYINSNYKDMTITKLKSVISAMSDDVIYDSDNIDTNKYYDVKEYEQ